MRPEWFEEYVRTWDPKLGWTREELKVLSRELLAVCELNGGTVYFDKGVAQELVKDHCLERVEAALNRLAIFYANHLKREKGVPDHAVVTDSFRASLPFVTAFTYVPKLNLNTATQEELESLPGLGKVTAARVIEARERRGGFRTPQDVEEVKGIGRDGFQKISHAVYAESSVIDPIVTSSAIATFLREPKFVSYVKVAKEHGLTLTKYRGAVGGGTKERLLEQVRGLRCELEQDAGYNPYKPLPGITASQLERRRDEVQRAQQVEDLAIHDDDMHGVVLDDSDYPYFLRDLLKAAKQNIRIIMFFMRFDEEGKYPTDTLFAELLAAHGRKVDIRIILDRDAEGEAINSRVVNEEAYQYLRKNGIAVIYDSVDRYTHTKLVVVDKLHVVIGSHNWTAGSFFAYDDTSIYVHSAQLGAHYGSQFEKLWTEYGGK